MTCLLIFLAINSVAAQIVHQNSAAAYSRLDAYTTDGSNVFSFSANAASLVHFTTPVIGVYAENRFGLKELTTFQMAAALPATSGNFGVSLSYFGSAEHNQLQTKLVYGRKLGNKVSVGAGFNYSRINVAGYGSAGAVSIEGGILLQVTDQLQTGFQINNPTGARWSKGENEQLPSVYTMGLGYKVSDKFFAGIEIEKREESKINVTGGVQYQFDKKIGARVGFTSATSGYYLGGSFLIQGIRMDITAAIHPQLGITPGLMLLYKRSQE